MSPADKMNLTTVWMTANTTVSLTRNSSDILDNSSADFYVEDYSSWIKICFAIIGTITLVTSCIAFTAMYRTRRVPHAAKFLAMGLLIFDAAFIIFSTVRKFVPNPMINTNLMVCGTVNILLSYVTVGLMSVERYFVCNWPNKYLRYCSTDFVRRGAFAVWSICFLAFLLVRYGLCYVQYGERMLYAAGQCLMTVTVFYSGLVVVVVCVSSTCYYKIFNTIRVITSRSNDRRRLSLQSTAKVLRSYKSTSLVLVYLIVILITSVTYLVLLVSVRYFNLGVQTLRFTLEIVSIMNCILDPYLYVLWFSETKMEVLKLLAPCSGRLQTTVEKMRTRIFEIHVSIVPSDFNVTEST